MGWDKVNELNTIALAIIPMSKVAEINTLFI